MSTLRRHAIDHIARMATEIWMKDHGPATRWLPITVDLAVHTAREARKGEGDFETVKAAIRAAVEWCDTERPAA